MNYQERYSKRLNRYGIDYQSRIQTERERLFELRLLKSTYRVDFEFENKIYAGSFEPRKQDQTEALHYLLTSVQLDLPNGTILMIPDKNKECQPWMVYYLEEIHASGYNRYTMLRMTHYITWKDKEGWDCESWAYMYGQEDNMLKNELRSRSRSDALYGENLKLNFFVMPRNENIKKEILIEVGEEPFKEEYRVTGYDLQSTPGIEYVSVDPTYLHDKSNMPRKTQEDTPEDFYWLTGGEKKE